MTRCIYIRKRTSLAALTVAVQDSSTSSTTTILAPASIAAGDLLVLWDYSRGNPAPTDVVPTNFTRITTNAFTLAGDHRAVASYKIADGTEDGATITGMAVGASGGYKAMYQFRASRAITAVSISAAVGQESTTGNPAAQTVSAAGGTPPLIVFGCYGTSGTVDPRTFTVSGSAAKDGEITPHVRCYLAYKIYNTSPADVVVDMDDEGSNGLGSFYLALTG